MRRALAPPADRRMARGWRSRILAAVEDGEMATHYQPIVDLSRGLVVGYEALSRFSDPGFPNPEEWFRAAQACGLGGRLEAAALRRALSERPSIPPKCFLSLNLGPDSLGEPEVRAVLAEQGDLTGVVIELTEQSPVDSYLLLRPSLDAYREAGAMIAVDDLGSGYAGLQHLVNLRPSFIKLDKHFVAGIAQEEAKRALVEMLGTFSQRIDCWLVAEGIERPEELQVLCSLGVPLGQGYLLGRPAPTWGTLAPEARRLLLDGCPRAPSATVGDLVRCSPTVSSLEELPSAVAAQPSPDVLVVLDPQRRPTGVILVDAPGPRVPVKALRVHLDTPLAEAARRAIVRPRHSRFHPLVCTDDEGAYVGTVGLDRLIAELAGEDALRASSSA